MTSVWGRSALSAAAFLTPLAFVPSLADPFEVPKLALASVLALVAGFTWDGRMPAALRVPAGMALVVLAAGVSESVAPLASFVGSAAKADGAVALALFVLLAVLASTREDDSVLGALAAGSALAAGYGVVQSFGLDPLPWAVGPEFGNPALLDRAFGTLANPSFLGLQAAVALPVAVGLAAKNRWHWASVAALVGGLGASQSRAAWLGAVLGLLLLVVLSAKGSRRTPALVLGAVVVLVGVGGMGQRWSDVRLDGGSTAVRRDLAAFGLQRLAERPILGHGPATYGPVLIAEAPPEMPPDVRTNPSSHNLLIDVAFSGGALGLAVLFLWAGAAGRAVWASPSLAGSLLAAAVALQLGFGGVAAWVSIALVAGCAFQNQPVVRLSPWWGRSLAGLVAAASLWMAWAVSR